MKPYTHWGRPIDRAEGEPLAKYLGRVLMNTDIGETWRRRKIFSHSDVSMLKTMTWAKDNPYTREAWIRLLEKVESLSAPHPQAGLGEWLSVLTSAGDNPWLPSGKSPCGKRYWCAGPDAPSPPPCPVCGSTEVV